MSLTILKSLLKKNALLYWIFTAVIVGYFFLSILMFPLVQQLFENMPPAFADLFGDTTVTGYTAMLFGELVWPFGMILFIMLVFRTIYKPVDSGSLSTHLMGGVSRNKYMITACVFLALKLIIMFVLILTVTLISFAILGEEFVFIDFFASSLLSMLALTAVVFISFMLGAIFAGKKMALGLLIGIPVAFLIVLMIAGIHSSVEFFRWVSVFGWFNPSEVAAGDFGLWWLVAIGYVLAAVSCAIFATTIFKKKNLSL